MAFYGSNVVIVVNSRPDAATPQVQACAVDGGVQTAGQNILRPSISVILNLPVDRRSPFPGRC